MGVPKLSRPALAIAACIFICALVMLCVAQLSAVRVSPADMGPQAAAASVQVADTTHTDGTHHTSATAADVAVADVSSELSEAMLPVRAAMSPGVQVVQPAAPVAVALPHPLIKGPQRPPRSLHA